MPCSRNQWNYLRVQGETLFFLLFFLTGRLSILQTWFVELVEFVSSPLATTESYQPTIGSSGILFSDAALVESHSRETPTPQKCPGKSHRNRDSCKVRPINPLNLTINKLIYRYVFDVVWDELVEVLNCPAGTG
jgi:hypothetical protein